MIASLLLIYMIISDRKRKLAKPFHRLVLLMSIFDVFQSLAIVISVAAFPQESNIHGAHGNARTCTAQGFFMVLGFAVPLYNSSLNIFYVLTIRYNFSPKRFAKFEPVLHTIAILIPLALAT